VHCRDDRSLLYVWPVSRTLVVFHLHVGLVPTMFGLYVWSFVNKYMKPLHVHVTINVTVTDAG